MVSAKGEENVTDGGRKGKRNSSGGGDDDKTGRKWKNRGVFQFFADEGEDSSGDSMLDLDDFFEDKSSSDLIVDNEPAKVPHVPFLPKEKEMSKEELERMMEERHKPGAGFVTYMEDFCGNESDKIAAIMEHKLKKKNDREPRQVGQSKGSRLEQQSFEDIYMTLSGNLALVLNASVAACRRGRALEAENKELIETVRRQEQKMVDLAKEREKWKARYEHEVKTGERFLQSSNGLQLVAKRDAMVVEALKASDAFKEAVLDEFALVFDRAVRHCRRVLKKSGRFSDSDVALLDLGVSDDENG